MNSVLRTENLTVAYGARVALDGVSCSFEPAKLTANIGPNGAGESTLIKAMMKLVPVINGQTLFAEAPIRPGRSPISYLPQQSSVDWAFPVSVLDVVMMGTYHRVGWFRQPGKKELSLAMNSLETVGMSDLKDRQIGELSGGQRQRVFLARSLAQEAEIFLMDEPFAGIDTRTEDMLLEVFHDLQRAGKTLIVVHHDLGTVRDRFQNAILLQRKLIASGPVSDVLTSKILAQAYDGGAIPEVG